MYFNLVFVAICAIAIVACEARESGYTGAEGQQDDAARNEMRRYGSEEHLDFKIQELKYKPHATYDQNTGKGRRVANEQRPRNYRVQQQSGSAETVNGIYRETAW